MFFKLFSFIFLLKFLTEEKKSEGKKSRNSSSALLPSHKQKLNIYFGFNIFTDQHKKHNTPKVNRKKIASAACSSFIRSAW